MNESVDTKGAEQRFADGKCADASPQPQWFPEINSVEYRNRIMPHFRELLGKIDANGGTMYDSNLRWFLDHVLIITQEEVERSLPGSSKATEADLFPIVGTFAARDTQVILITKSGKNLPVADCRGGFLEASWLRDALNLANKSIPGDWPNGGLMVEPAEGG